MLPSVEEILEIFQWGGQEQKVTFIDTCPIELFKSLARHVADREATMENTCQLLDFLSRGSQHRCKLKSDSCFWLAPTFYQLWRERFALVDVGDRAG